MFFAYLDKHSNPKDPDPENKSNTFEFLKSIFNRLECKIILNIDSFT